MAPLANLGTYDASDVVFVSSEGARGGRFDPVPGGRTAGAYRDLDLAVAAGASFVVDAPADRARAYNVGERQATPRPPPASSRRPARRGRKGRAGNAGRDRRRGDDGGRGPRSREGCTWRRQGGAGAPPSRSPRSVRALHAAAWLATATAAEERVRAEVLRA